MRFINKALTFFDEKFSLKYIKKKKVPNICDRNWEPCFLVSLIANYAPGEIAPLGQTSAQVPQSTQTSGSIE